MNRKRAGHGWRTCHSCTRSAYSPSRFETASVFVRDGRPIKCCFDEAASIQEPETEANVEMETDSAKKYAPTYNILIKFIFKRLRKVW